MALTVGSRLAHYDVTALIGEGGMGQVYRAIDPVRSQSRGIAKGGILSDHPLYSTPSVHTAGGTEYSVLVVAVDNGQAALGAGVRCEARCSC